MLARFILSALCTLTTLSYCAEADIKNTGIENIYTCWDKNSSCMPVAISIKSMSVQELKQYLNNNKIGNLHLSLECTPLCISITNNTKELCQIDSKDINIPLLDAQAIAYAIGPTYTGYKRAAKIVGGVITGLGIFIGISWGAGILLDEAAAATISTVGYPLFSLAALGVDVMASPTLTLLSGTLPPVGLRDNIGTVSNFSSGGMPSLVAGSLIAGITAPILTYGINKIIDSRREYVCQKILGCLNEKLFTQSHVIEPESTVNLLVFVNRANYPSTFQATLHEVSGPYGQYTVSIQDIVPTNRITFST